ncbi:MAG: hypothetical protein Q8S00_01820 [Deltaproteobacteria bacterium]|nr:hypothetical protein [Deltaproteobacteria bacterium]MDZ4346284.1 hypothetical protein [Candidatus Binatia bacterium]
MTINSVRFLGYRKAGRCDHCRRRVGSKGKAVIVRLAVSDPIHGVMGVGICFECIGEWAATLEPPAPRRRTGVTPKTKRG